MTGANHIRFTVMLNECFTSSSAETIRLQVFARLFCFPNENTSSSGFLHFVFWQDFYSNAEQDKLNNFGGIDGRGRKKQDPPIEKDLMLSLEECYHGCIKKMKISRRVCYVTQIFLDVRVFQT
jgi:hypothetical protein